MEVPEDIREKAKGLWCDLSCGMLDPVGVLTQALLSERLAQKERDAKIAEAFYIEGRDGHLISVAEHGELKRASFVDIPMLFAAAIRNQLSDEAQAIERKHI